MNPRTEPNHAPDAAFVDGKWFTDVVEVTNDLYSLESFDQDGQWVVAVPYSGTPVCVKFRSVEYGSIEDPPRELHDFLTTTQHVEWPLPGSRPDRSNDSVDELEPDSLLFEQWESSCDEEEFALGVQRIQDAITTGDVYQVNLTRRMQRDLSHVFEQCPTVTGDLQSDSQSRTNTNISAALTWHLAQALTLQHPAPHSATIALPSQGIYIASASPELFLERRQQQLISQPIKGTARNGEAFLDKDWAENVMIVDLVRNDLGQVCTYGSVEVPQLCITEDHPGLSHLVSTVQGALRPDISWAEIFGATFPAGSITGAPKSAAMQFINELEPLPRSWYCGTLGWVDTQSGQALLNVAIRTFWIENQTLHFGTGGGITIDSDPRGEWQETVTKARELIRVANRIVAESTEQFA